MIMSNLKVSDFVTFEFDSFIESLKRDKKNSETHYMVVLPVGDGEVELTQRVAIQQMVDAAEQLERTLPRRMRRRPRRRGVIATRIEDENTYTFKATNDRDGKKGFVLAFIQLVKVAKFRV